MPLGAARLAARARKGLKVGQDQRKRCVYGRQVRLQGLKVRLGCSLFSVLALVSGAHRYLRLGGDRPSGFFGRRDLGFGLDDQP